MRADSLGVARGGRTQQFYTNMRQHTDLCTEVRRNAEQIPFLQALSAVANTAHLCGRYSCADAVLYLSRGGGLPVLVAALLALVMAPSALWALWRWLMARAPGKDCKMVRA